MSEAQVFEGLAGVLVARTELSWVDGERGQLLLRGHGIESLASAVPFEAVCGLLWENALPEPRRLQQLREELGAARVAAHERLATRYAAVAAPDAMSTLRSALSLLPESATPLDL